jgi:S-adenosylmethionine hydrolase
MTVNALRLRLGMPLLTAAILLVPGWAFSEQARTLTGKVVAVGTSFGNLDTDIPIGQLSIELGESFSARCTSKTVTAISSADYADVHSGEWLGIENEAGNLQLAISFGDASEGLGCTTGDNVTITF